MKVELVGRTPSSAGLGSLDPSCVVHYHDIRQIDATVLHQAGTTRQQALAILIERLSMTADREKVAVTNAHYLLAERNHGTFVCGDFQSKKNSCLDADLRQLIKTRRRGHKTPGCIDFCVGPWEMFFIGKIALVTTLYETPLMRISSSRIVFLSIWALEGVRAGGATYKSIDNAKSHSFLLRPITDQYPHW